MPQLVKKLLASSKNIHFQSLLGNGVLAVFGLLILSILYHTLSLDDAGIYALFLVIFGFVDTFRTGFLTFAFVKFYTGTQTERAREITGSAWCLAMIITAGFIILNFGLWGASSFIHDDGVLFFIKYFPWVFIAGLPYFMATLIVQGDKRFDRLLWLRLVNQALYAAIIIVLVVLKRATLDAVLIAYIASNLTASLFAIFAGWTMLGAIRDRTNKGIAELYHFGKFSLGTNLSASLFKMTDVFFISNYLDNAALAIYNLGGRLLQIIEVPLGSFTASGMSIFAEHFNKNEKKEMMDLMKKMTGIVSIGLFIIAIFSIIFAGPIIHLIGGDKYIHTAAPNLFRIFMSFAVMYPADRFFAITLDVIHKPQINFYKILMMLAANIIGDFAGLTIHLSIYSIVIAGILPLLTAVIAAYIPLNKYLPFNFWKIYSTGYKESILLIKEGWEMLKGSDRPVNNS